MASAFTSCIHYNLELTPIKVDGIGVDPGFSAGTGMGRGRDANIQFCQIF